MCLKRHMKINGVCQSRIEPVIPEISVIPLGIAATNMSNAIRVKLRLVREIDMVYPYENKFYKRHYFLPY